jgi:hypothetical protein
VNSRVLNLTLILGLIFGLVGMTGCSDKDGNEWERLVCEVESVNLGVPLISAYVDLGSDVADPDDDSYPIDFVPVVFRARPYSTALTIPEDSAHSWFHITSYNLTWVPAAGTPAALTNFNIVGGLCDVIVPVNDEGLVNVLIADRQMKEQTWFSDLTTTGLNYGANCQLDFFGHETGSDREIRVSGGMTVTFLGAVISD